MITNTTGRTAVVDCWYENDPGYYEISYPSARLHEHDNEVTVDLTSRECQGLTLALLKGLDSATSCRLVWVSNNRMR